MAEVLVVGKKISEMDLVTDIVGDEKIPTGVVGDKAVTTGQLLTYLDNNGKVQWGRIEGDIANQADLQNQFSQQLATLQNHIQDHGNPHNVTKEQVGLGLADNTADMDKPVSTAVQEALSLKADQTYVDDSLANKTHNSLLGRDADGAHPASAILDESGKDQQELNNIFKLEQVIDTRIYGVVANTPDDMTPFIHEAFTDNPEARVFYFPEGEILCNIVIPRSYICLKGQGLGVTKLIGFDGSKPTIDYNKKLYMGLKDISVHQRHDATAMIIKAWDTRYISYDNAELLQLADSSGNYTYSVDGLDLSNDTNYWTGYLYFKESRFNRCKNGVKTSGDLVSATYFDNCVIAWNGEFGAILNNVVGGGMNNCDIATNGQLAIPLGEYDENKYGGVWVKGRNFNIDGAWHEFNRGKFGFPGGSDYPNDLYIHPDSVNVTETNPRRQRSLSGGYLLTESQASQSDNGYSDTVIDTGMGVSKHQNLLSNGDFKYSLTDWLSVNITGADWSLNSDDCPKGFERVLRLNSTGGSKSLYQKIYEGGQTGNSIDNLAHHIGKTISITCWVKNISPTISSVRVGFDTGAVGTNVYFSTGAFINNTPLNKWVQVVLTHKIKGDEGRLFAGIRTIGDVLICGFNCQFGSRVAAYEPKRITEDGGKVYGEVDAAALKKNGVDVATIEDVDNSIRVRTATTAALSSATNVVNTDKRHPSLIFNSTSGRMYFSTGSSATSAWRATDGSGDIIPA